MSSEYIVDRTFKFAKDCSELCFSFDGYIYNPLEYAWECHRQFLEKYVQQGAKSIFLGMNPGPFGMMQTGVPFGEINAVKQYLKINGNVEKPKKEHPSRPVEGLDVKRSEISGQRLWGLISNKYPDADFADDIAMFNFCPLGFIDKGKTAKNITPDKLVKAERAVLENICMQYIRDVTDCIKPKYLVGVGKYAFEKLSLLNTEGKYKVFSIIHPSPGNPLANNGWAEKTRITLMEKGLWN